MLSRFAKEADIAFISKATFYRIFEAMQPAIMRVYDWHKGNIVDIVKPAYWVISCTVNMCHGKSHIRRIIVFRTMAHMMPGASQSMTHTILADSVRLSAKSSLSI